MISVKHCIAKYFSNHPEAERWQQVCFTAQVAQKQSPGRVFRGKSRRATLTPRVISAGDIYAIVEASFILNIFRVVGRSFRQLRGTSIGNQISPVLSAIAVAFEEYMWATTYSNFLESNRTTMFLMRYVDNRFLIFSDHLLKNKAMKLPCHPSFYRDPVTLEDVGDLRILGCLVDPEKRHVSYCSH